MPMTAYSSQLSLPFVRSDGNPLLVCRIAASLSPNSQKDLFPPMGLISYPEHPHVSLAGPSFGRPPC